MQVRARLGHIPGGDLRTTPVVLAERGERGVPDGVGGTAVYHTDR
jgi:hypothetical protein